MYMRVAEFVNDAEVRSRDDGFGGLVFSMLVSGTRVRGRSRWIFRASEKTSACLPSEGK